MPLNSSETTTDETTTDNTFFRLEEDEWVECVACHNLIHEGRMEILSSDQVNETAKLLGVHPERINPEGGPYCVDVISCASRCEYKARVKE